MIRVRVFNAHPRRKVNIKETVSLVRRVLKNEGTHDAELNIVFINDKRMIEMNGRYLDHWYTTDVLSFSLTDEGNEKNEGEVYINLDQARRQAKHYNVAIHNEVSRLVTHGILHLVGYRDNTRHEKKRMTEREDLYLRHKA